MTVRYVFDTGALVATERKKPRASRFLQLARVGAARVIVPLAVIAEWWRGRSDVCDEILASAQVVASVEIMKAAGVALAATRGRRIDAKLTIDTIVMATAAMLGAVVVTQDPDDFERLEAQFPGVVVLSV